MRAVVIPEPGPGAAPRIEDVPDPVVEAGEILVRVAAAGVNRADLLQVAGHYPPPPGAAPWPGLEVAGTVVALGPGVPPSWRVGDRVAGLLPGGGYAELAAVRADLALRVPDDVDEVAAGALPEALATAWSALHDARAVAGTSILVRGGSGGVGSVTVRLALALGLRVLATAGGPDRVARVQALGAHTVLDHREPDLAARVLDATAGRGVDVVLDVVGAAALAENLAMLADDGRLVVIGLQKGAHAELDLGLLLRRRARVIGTTLRSRPPEQKAAIMLGVRKHVWPLVAAGQVRAPVHATLPLAEAAEAHRLLASGEVFGKLVLLP